MAVIEGTSRHHALFEGLAWMARKETRVLRSMGGLIVRLADAPHSALHEEVATVPLPNVYVARFMLDNFNPTNDVLENIDRLSFVVEQAGNNPHARALELEHNNLIVACLQAQKPFIKEGMVNTA